MSDRLSVVTWKWGPLFSAVHVNALRAGLARHLHLDHALVCVTDDPSGLDADVRVVPMPEAYADTPRCRRRMQQYNRACREIFGSRMLAIDLDVVLVADLTPIVNRPEPIVCWKVGHAGVYSGSFVLCDVGALHGAWAAYHEDPLGYPLLVQQRGVPSDQAMLNHFLRSQPAIPYWTERDGFVTYYGRGYERLEHLGVGPRHPELPAGARIVVLGSSDLEVLTPGRYPWVDEHWVPLARRAA